MLIYFNCIAFISLSIWNAIFLPFTFYFIAIHENVSVWGFSVIRKFPTPSASLNRFSAHSRLFPVFCKNPQGVFCIGLQSDAAYSNFSARLGDALFLLELKNTSLGAHFCALNSVPLQHNLYALVIKVDELGLMTSRLTRNMLRC